MILNVHYSSGYLHRMLCPNAGSLINRYLVADAEMRLILLIHRREAILNIGRAALQGLIADSEHRQELVDVVADMDA